MHSISTSPKCSNELLIAENSGALLFLLLIYMKNVGLNSEFWQCERGVLDGEFYGTGYTNSGAGNLAVLEYIEDVISGDIDR